MKKILLIASILVATQGFSQRFGEGGLGDRSGNSGGANIQYDIYARTIDINQKSLSFGLTEEQFNAIKEEAYPNPNFIMGNIYQEDQLIKSGVPMRYNAYADEIEIKQSPTSESYGALVKNPSIFVKMGTDLYVFIPYQGGIEKGGYFNLLLDGKKYDLYKKTTAVFREPQEAKSTYGHSTPPSFPITTTYYLVENGTFLEMPNSKSRILKMMDSEKKEMKSYIKENNLDLDKEPDLIKAIAHFDSLM